VKEAACISFLLFGRGLRCFCRPPGFCLILRVPYALILPESFCQQEGETVFSSFFWRRGFSFFQLLDLFLFDNGRFFIEVISKVD
jgi:hypothetical protein